MVKGVARRVIMVKSPDPKLFDEALFLLREEALLRGSEDQVLKEAQQAANQYLHRNSPLVSHQPRLLPILAAFGGGAGLASLIWSLVVFFP